MPVPQAEVAAPMPAAWQLRRHALMAAIPSVGFGQCSLTCLYVCIYMVLPIHFSPAFRPLLHAATQRRCLLEGTDYEKQSEIATKFTNRARALATDGYIAYDIQPEDGRTSDPRPFPFRAMEDPSIYGQKLSAVSGKSCIVYKCVVEHSHSDLNDWLDQATTHYGHGALNLVGRSKTLLHNGPSCTCSRTLVGCTGPRNGGRHNPISVLSLS